MFNDAVCRVKGKHVLFMSGGQNGDRDWPKSQLGIVGRVTLPGDMTLTLLELWQTS